MLGLILYVLGGVGPAFMHSIATILLLRAVLGLGIGFITPLMNAYVAEYFEGQERSKMNGLTVGVNGLGGAFFLIIGGATTTLGWRGVFWTYSFGLLLLILVILFVPHDRPVRTTKTSDSSKKTASMPFGVYRIGLMTTGLMILYYVIPTNLASFVVDQGFGSSATSGYLTALSFVFVFLAGITGTRLNRLLRKNLVSLILLLLGLAFLLMSQAVALWMVALCVATVGFGFGLAYPLLLNAMAGAAPKENLTLAVMLMTAFANIGQFISPLLTNGIQSLFHLESITSVFVILTVIIAIILSIKIFQISTPSHKRDLAG